MTEGRFVVPEVVSTHFHLHEGDAVADFGAGSGFFVPVLSAQVGPSGRVYALEIQRNLTESISELVRGQNLSNVEVLWCDIEKIGGTKLDDGLLDAAIIVNTMFQWEQKTVAIDEVKRTLRSGGKLFVIDWTESFAGLGPQPDDVITEADARALIESRGFAYERSFDAADHHYGLSFRKP